MFDKADLASKSNKIRVFGSVCMCMFEIEKSGQLSSTRLLRKLKLNFLRKKKTTERMTIFSSFLFSNVTELRVKFEKNTSRSSTGSTENRPVPHNLEA